MSFIQVKGVDFSYKSENFEVPILKDFDLSISQGDFIAIKGPSGSGKSTLLYLLAGLLNISNGEVRINNQVLSSLSDLELSLLRNERIAFIFQQFHLLPKATVLDNILLPSFYPVEISRDREKFRRKAIQIANEIGIGERLSYLPNQLSGGQQQRVAIARALVSGADIILADEPTGNLDTKSTQQIIKILRDLNNQGKTIVLITHEDEVAKSASKIYHFKDGLIEHIEEVSKKSPLDLMEKNSSKNREQLNLFPFFKMIPLAWFNAFRNKTRSLLTMLGIIVGVAAVCSMITLGNFTKEKILKSYAELGVNTIQFRGWPNWTLKATDSFPLKFQKFSWENELLPLKKIFPSIKLLSPNLMNWESTVTYAGNTIENDLQVMGISEDGLKVLNRKLIAGRNFSPHHIERKHSVCIIGHEVRKKLFKNISPLNKVIHLSQRNSTYACKVIGVLKSKTTNKQWYKPNLQIIVPFTFFQTVSDHWWRNQIKTVTIQFYSGTNIQKAADSIKKFFELKYGISGTFQVDSDSILLEQMKKFLTLFSILLTAIALISLIVGGMGITNMMLVSVSERLKEIGLRKSLGATHSSIRFQFLSESLILCSLAGILGLAMGIVTYQGAIFGASKLMDKLEYEWVFDPVAISLSFISIFLVGVFSGLAPAIKAEKLQVIDALRSD